MTPPESNLIIKGQSMHPLFREGDELRVRYFSEPQPLESLSLGRVVLLREGGEWVVHRVVEFKSKRATKGDWSMSLDEASMAWGEVIAQNGQDPPWLESQQIARISAKIRPESSRWIRRLARLQLWLFFWSR